MKCYGLPYGTWKAYHFSSKYYGGHHRPAFYRKVTHYMRHRARMAAKEELRKMQEEIQR